MNNTSLLAKGRKDTALPSSTSTADHHVFKKARYAWQIKGRRKREDSTSSGHCPERSWLEKETSLCVDKTVAIHGSILESHIEQKHHESNVLVQRDYTSTPVVSSSQEDNLAHAYQGETDHVSGLKSHMINWTSVEEAIQGHRKTSVKPLSSSHVPKNISQANKRKQSYCLDENEPKNKKMDISSSSSSKNKQNFPEFIQDSSSKANTSNCVFDIGSFLWQKQEMGCAIVDNVFNRTLEEMGLSPDPKVNAVATARLALMNHSIETAIQSQGLRASQNVQANVLADIEEFRRNATLQDAQNTQNQLRSAFEMGHLSGTININQVCPHIPSVIQNSLVHENPLEVPRASSEMRDNGAPTVLHPCDSSVDKSVNFQLNDSDEDSKSNDWDCSSYGCGSNGQFIYINQKHARDNSENENIENTLIENMDVSDCFSLCNEEKAEDDNVLDLAVSTAILSQGLTYNSTHSS